MKFVFLIKASPAWQAGLAQLRQEFPRVTFIPQAELTETDITQAHAFVADRVTAEQLGLARALKILFLTYTGPNFLPLKELAQRGVRIANTHGNAQSVAERGIALALAFYGRLIDYHADFKQGRWHGAWGGKGLADTWESLEGKHCAVIGTGEIGKCLARMLKVFGCRVTGVKRRPAEGLLENFDHITLDLADALSDSELVFVTLPQTRETEGMFNAEVLAGMQGKFLVNLGRGAVIEEEALYHALKNGILKGAALDVWYTYPRPGETGTPLFPSRFAFHELPNVVLSPHVAGFTRQAIEANISQTIDNIRAYLRTGRPRYEVDPQRMY
jgi:phosphoglycerate dehydrogenase-like enzyme